MIPVISLNTMTLKYEAALNMDIEFWCDEQNWKVVGKYDISSNKRQTSNKCSPLMSATPLGIHIEISTSL